MKIPRAIRFGTRRVFIRNFLAVKLTRRKPGRGQNSPKELRERQRAS